MPHPSGPVARSFADRVRTLERDALQPLAVRSYATRGREHPEPDDCPLRTPFQRDRDRIVHAKAFRRLKHKTQVFIAPEGDHFRTRLTHTLEVSGISRGVARALRLNEDLTEAIALGHDLGHAPFGHTGEDALDRALRARGSHFRHNEQSLRIVDRLERDGDGLNLTHEVRDGILTHTGPERPQTLEGRIVRLVDRFGYVNHDIDDAARGGILDPATLPGRPVSLLGETSSTRRATTSAPA
jgi:dGTPase